MAKDSLPRIINAALVPQDYLAPLFGVAEVLQPESGQRPFHREEILDLGGREQIQGLIISGEIPVDEGFLDGLPELRVIANTAVGYDNLPLELLERRGIWATNTPDSFIDATADATLGLLLAVARKLVLADRYVRSGDWARGAISPVFWEGMELRGKTWGIVGYGQIGEAVARRAEAFGMDILYHRRRKDGDPRRRELSALLAESDVVSLHTPLTPETRHLMDAETIRSMKAGAILLNLARGAVVHEGALVAALQSGHLAGAGLDVFEAEPQVHPELTTLDTVVLAPHLGGATREARRHARLLAAKNVARVLQGLRPRTPLNEPGGDDGGRVES